MAQSESRVLDPHALLAQVFPKEGNLTRALALCDSSELTEFVRALYPEFKNNPGAQESANVFF